MHNHQKDLRSKNQGGQWLLEFRKSQSDQSREVAVDNLRCSQIKASDTGD